MTSPFTGGKVTLKCEPTVITYRGEEYSCNRYFYVCDDTGIEFTDAELDDKGLSEVHAQYRKNHGIPSPAELTNLRNSIEIPARTMSLMLGLGENQYRLYENGEMPSESIGKMLSTLFIPGVIESYITSSKNLFTASKYKRALSNLRHEKNATYYAIEEINPLKLASTFASPSVIKMSKSRWTDTDERISYNNTAMLSFV